jgi:hypothetical protein
LASRPILRDAAGAPDCARKCFGRHIFQNSDGWLKNRMQTAHATPSALPSLPWLCAMNIRGNTLADMIDVVQLLDL